MVNGFQDKSNKKNKNKAVNFPFFIKIQNKNKEVNFPFFIKIQIIIEISFFLQDTFYKQSRIKFWFNDLLFQCQKNAR